MKKKQIKNYIKMVNGLPKSQPVYKCNECVFFRNGYCEYTKLHVNENNNCLNKYFKNK